MITVRQGTDADSADLIRIMAASFDAYPGCLLDVDGEMPELRSPASYMEGKGGGLWVAENTQGQVIATIACRPAKLARVWELKWLYVDPAGRRQGIAQHLAGLMESHAAAQQAHVMELWTDTRFLDAHRLYGRLGYSKRPESVQLHDISNSTEYHFWKRLQRI